MGKGSIIFDKQALSTRLFNYYAEEQTKRLIDYAIETIEEIGLKINSYHSKNHMDRTGNLLDSLCWGVLYNGELKASGFYRNQKATELSFLHEWSDHDHWFPVGGHTLALNFIKQMSNLHTKNWRVFFAILAPYWGYWEKGFRMKQRPSEWDEGDVDTRSKFLKFAVMTEFYDKVTRDLKPASTKISVGIPDTTDPRIRAKRIKMRDYRMDRNLGSPYDKYKGKYSIDKSYFSRKRR